MRTAAPPLLPIFRSKTQSELLSETYLHPREEFSLAALARRTGAALSTVHREVAQLLAAGLLTERRIGHVRQVRANADGPFFEPLRQLLERAFGAEARLRDALADMPQVQGAWLFGSYARRLAGEPGVAPNDVDVAVIVTDGAEAVYQACARVGAALALEVNATVLTPDEWADTDDVFIRQLHEGTRIDLLDRTTQSTPEESR